MSEIKIIDNTIFSTADRAALDTLQTALGLGYELIDGVLSESSGTPKCTWEAITDPPQESGDAAFYATKQKIRIIGNLSDFSSHEEWKDFLLRTIPVGNIINHACNVPTIDEENSNNTGPSAYISSSFKHNISFYEYERISRLVPTKMLPNYSIMQYYNTYGLGLGISHPSYRDYITSSAGLGVGMQIEGPSEYESYYDNYIENINLISNNSGVQVDQNTNLFILNESYDSSFDSTKNLPHFIKYEMFASVSPVDSLMLLGHIATTKKRKQFFDFIASSDPLLLGFTDSNGIGKNIKTYNFLEFISSLTSNAFVPAPDKLYIHSYPELNQGTAIERMVENIMLYAGTLEVAKINMRTIGDLWDNRPCSKDIIGFKVEKFLDTTNGAPAQTIYILGNDASFVDTQIKYDQRYVYKISAIVAVMGSTYSYTNSGHSTPEGDFVNLQSGLPQPAHPDTLNYWYSAEVDIIIRPSIQILEIPLEDRMEHFIEIPPNRPDVAFTNESGKNNEVKIHLSNNFGTNQEHYKVLTNTDIRTLESVRINQKIDSDMVETSFLYNSGRFEIFRLDSLPSSMEDFNNNFLTEIKEESMDHLTIGTYGLSTSGGQDKRIIWQNVESMASGYSRNRFVHSAVFKDFILSNKKYYYLFRALTESGIPSAPSEIYQVELIEDSDESRVEVNIYEFPEEKNYQHNKLMKRFFQIIPNPSQVQINSESIASFQSAEEGEPILGDMVTESVFNKKFKIRITSEHTGKKIDFNIVFKKTME